MIKKELSIKFLDELVYDLRDEDKAEMLQVFPTNLNEFYNICFEDGHKIYFVTTDNSEPLAVGGAYSVRKSALPTAQVWLLTTNKLQKNKIALYKYVNELIEEFKKEYDVLFNFIYKSNFSSLKWIEHMGFRIVDLKNQDYKLFYYYKGGRLDLRYFTS